MSPIELNLFSCFRHSPLWPPKMSDQSETLLQQNIFRVTNSDSSMYCATVANFKLKVQIVNDLLGKNFAKCLPYAKTSPNAYPMPKLCQMATLCQKPRMEKYEFPEKVPFRTSLVDMTPADFKCYCNSCRRARRDLILASFESYDMNDFGIIWKIWKLKRIFTTAPLSTHNYCRSNSRGRIKVFF